MRIATNYIQQQSVDAMLKHQVELSKTQNQVSTGERFNSAYEDPISAIKTLDLERQINLNQQYLDNAATAENKLTVTDGILSNAGDIMQRIRELAVQGLNDVVGDGRDAIAAEINELNEALLGLANARDANGEAVFSGYQSDVDAFNATTYAYNGDNGQRNIRIGDSYLVEVNEPGNAVFVTDMVTGPPASQAIFQTIANFSASLTNNTVGTAPNDSEFLANMSNGLDSVYAARTRIGARLNAVDAQRVISEDVKFRDQATVSEFRDLDYAEAITRMNLQMTGLQAAQQAYVKVQGLSLFNVL